MNKQERPSNAMPPSPNRPAGGCLTVGLAVHKAAKNYE